jgi:uncharacterized protein YbaR (Trm112 family)
MAIPECLAELLACPACGTRLAGTSCLSCRIDFPEIGGIPWLMPEPRLALTEWRGRLHYLLDALRGLKRRASAGPWPMAALGSSSADASSTWLPRWTTRPRASAKLMLPLGIDRRSEAHAVHVALGTELPLHQGLSTYYPNLHRDWCWGDAENQASLAAVLACFRKLRHRNGSSCSVRAPAGSPTTCTRR